MREDLIVFSEPPAKLSAGYNFYNEDEEPDFYFPGWIVWLDECGQAIVLYREDQKNEDDSPKSKSFHMLNWRKHKEELSVIFAHNIGSRL